MTVISSYGSIIATWLSYHTLVSSSTLNRKYTLQLFVQFCGHSLQSGVFYSPKRQNEHCMVITASHYHTLWWAINQEQESHLCFRFMLNLNFIGHVFGKQENVRACRMGGLTRFSCCINCTWFIKQQWTHNGVPLDWYIWIYLMIWMRTNARIAVSVWKFYVKLCQHCNIN